MHSSLALCKHSLILLWTISCYCNAYTNSRSFLICTTTCKTEGTEENLHIAKRVDLYSVTTCVGEHTWQHALPVFPGDQTQVWSDLAWCPAWAKKHSWEESYMSFCRALCYAKLMKLWGYQMSICLCPTHRERMQSSLVSVYTLFCRPILTFHVGWQLLTSIKKCTVHFSVCVG